MSSKQRNAEKRRERAEADAREEEERARLLAEKRERYRGLPRSEWSFDDLAEAIGQEHAGLVRELIRDMIAEALEVRRDDQ